MFREISLKDRAISNEECVDIITKGAYGVLSTIGEDGYPYGVPLNYTYYNDCICFHCGRQGHKIENIQFNEKVSFCVVERSEVLASKFDTDYKSAIAFGKAVDVADDSEKEQILLSLITKFSQEHMPAGKNYIKKYWNDTRVIKITIEHLRGKAYRP